MKSSIRHLKDELNLINDCHLKAEKANDLSRSYLYRDISQAEKYAKLAIELIDDESHQETLRAYLNLGVCNLLRQNFESGISYYYKIFISSPSDYLLLRCYMAIGVCYTKVGMYHEANQLQEKALTLSLKIDNINATAGILNNLATNYMHQNQHDVSEEYFLEAIELTSKYNFTNIQAYLYVGLLNNDLRRKNFDSADEYFFKIEELIDGENEMWYVGITQCLKACYYVCHDNLELAYDYFDIGLDILETERQLMYLVLAYDEFINSLHTNGHAVEANRYLLKFEATIDKYDLQMGRCIFLRTAMTLHSDNHNIKAYHKYQDQHEAYKLVVTKELNKFT